MQANGASTIASAPLSMGKQAPVVRGAGSSSGQKRTDTVEEEDDDPGWLSLGSIYSSAAAASASPTLAGDSCTPVTPVPHMDELGTPSAAATHQLTVAAGNASAPAFAPCSATPVLNGNGSACLASSVLTSTKLAGDGNAAVLAPVPVPGTGNISVLTQLGPLPVPSRCIRLSTNPLPAKEGAAPRPLPLRSQLQRQHASLTSPPQRSTRRRTDGYSASSSGSGGSSNGAPQPAPSSDGDPRANNGTGAHGGEGPNNGDPPANNGTGADGGEAPNSGGLLENPPFPWATNRVAIHHSIAELCSRGITTIEGEADCKGCKTHRTISYDIKGKFKELTDFILCNIHDMDDRAPARWTSPSMPDCDNCGQKNSLKPVIPTAKKEEINWLFLMLGQMLGLCSLEQLKYFCAHTKQHRTGAKDRVLYSTYMELCNQLFPNGPFDMTSQRKNRNRRYS